MVFVPLNTNELTHPHKYYLGIDYVPGTFLGARNTKWTKLRPCPHEAYIQKEADNNLYYDAR